ncbi:MAG: chlorite dismutase family protein [Propionibacteriaceae bacterium]|nr:chlorite dismutase family protein [Propionibacteriaceae bacterium]
MYTHDPRDDQSVDIAEVNSRPRYGMHVVLAADRGFRSGLVPEAAALTGQIESCGVTIRGFYDVAGFTADADLMVWMTCDEPAPLQAAYRTIQYSALGDYLTPVWSVIGVHRPAEFNSQHIPACFGGVQPREWLVVYPFVRSLDWYYLPAEKRAEMLKEHGMAARPYPDVKGSTLSGFALGDYEWILSFEADELHRLTDAMRHQRAAEARLHVREETPFFTGPRVGGVVWLARWP